MDKQFRPTAIPLITCDPYFSVWSFEDKLYDDNPRHWTGMCQSMCGILLIDGEPYRFMGLAKALDTYMPNGKTLEQTSVRVAPTTTVYTFTHKACDLKVTFVTPLLMDDLALMSRPASYIYYEITPKEQGHTFEFYIDACAELVGDPANQTYIGKVEEGHSSLGPQEQNVLCRSGDNVRIEWGYLHMVHPNADCATHARRHMYFRKGDAVAESVWRKDLSKPMYVRHMPILFTTSDKLSDVIVLAYDDIKAIRHYEDDVDAYYKKVYGDFDTMLKAAVEEADSVRKKCAKFDAELIAKMEKVSPEYAKVGALAYRQAISAHKLIEVDGELMFLSKENMSNGCIGTLDVTYPSIPLFLIYNPELVRAMMRPLFEYARKDAWEYRFAPHDCGCYPYCTGQVYGLKDGVMQEEMQMPVEECGNAILTVAAAVRADGDRSLADKNYDLLRQWADYLVVYGYDPENQLCTDDFAGHLAHNCNLSLKAIVALGAYAQLFDEPQYMEVAKDMADRWVKDAKKQDGKGWRLTFDKDDTWSMKYNIIWDRLLDLGIFDSAVSEEEIEVYISKMNKYGIPLDSRSDYSKVDWMAWTTVMTDNDEYTDMVYKSIAKMICESEDRVPITDWYFTLDGRQAGFQARSVLGGFYINLLADMWKK